MRLILQLGADYQAPTLEIEKLLSTQLQTLLLMDKDEFINNRRKKLLNMLLGKLRGKGP